MHHLAEERSRLILEILQEHGELVISTISRDLGVSDMTVRRDLKRMEDQGLLIRVHGGAIAAESVRFGDRLTANEPTKRRAARKLEDLLPPRGTIYMDGSTTILNLCDKLKAGRGLQVVTNNVESFRRLTSIPGIDPLLIGGKIDPRTDNLVGALALRSLHALAFDAAFFSCYGLTPELGPMEMTLEDAEIKQLVAQRASHVYLAADSSKLGRLASGTWDFEPETATFATDLPPDHDALVPYRKRFATIL